MKESLSAGHISRMFWEAVMKTGEVKLPIHPPTPTPPGVLAMSEQTKKERQSEPVAAQNVSSLRGINPSANKPPSEFRRSSAAPASTQHDSTASDHSRTECSHVAGGRGDKGKSGDENDKLLTHT